MGLICRYGEMGSARDCWFVWVSVVMSNFLLLVGFFCCCCFCVGVWVFKYFFTVSLRERGNEQVYILITHVFTYVFVTLSILQSQFIETGFMKTENSEQCGVTLVFIYAR